MSKRELCLEYIINNYDQWPAADTLSPTAATHHGYRWNKPMANGPWVLLQGKRGDLITEADFTTAWEGSIRMSDHFDCEAYLPSYLVDRAPDDEISFCFSVKQARAMLLAVAKYDGMKAKLEHASKSAHQLAKEIGE